MGDISAMKGIHLYSKQQLKDAFLPRRKEVQRNQVEIRAFFKSVNGGYLPTIAYSTQAVR
jgi:hypothetical protein